MLRALRLDIAVEDSTSHGRLGMVVCCGAAERIAKGLVDADFGRGIVMQRIVRPGRDKSAGCARSWFCVAESARSSCMGSLRAIRKNLRRKELTALRVLADELRVVDGPCLEAMLANGMIGGVSCDSQGS